MEKTNLLGLLDSKKVNYVFAMCVGILMMGIYRIQNKTHIFYIE